MLPCSCLFHQRSAVAVKLSKNVPGLPEGLRWLKCAFADRSAFGMHAFSPNFFRVVAITQDHSVVTRAFSGKIGLNAALIAFEGLAGLICLITALSQLKSMVLFVVTLKTHRNKQDTGFQNRKTDACFNKRWDNFYRA